MKLSGLKMLTELLIVLHGDVRLWESGVEENEMMDYPAGTEAVIEFEPLNLPESGETVLEVHVNRV